LVEVVSTLQTTSVRGSAQAPASGKVCVIDTVDGFASLRDAWDRLVSDGRESPIFLCHGWFDAAWRWHAKSASLHILAYFEGTELKAILPLVRQTWRIGTQRIRALEFLSVPDAQHCDVVVAHASRAVAARAFVEELAARHREWDVLRLGYLHDDSVASTELRSEFGGRGFRSAVCATNPNPFVCLDSTWSCYYDTRTRRLKKASNLAANRVERAGPVRIEWLSPGSGNAEDVDRVIKTIVGISARSWKAKTGNSLDQSGPQQLIRRLSAAAHERGWLSVWILYLRDLPVAMEYQLVAEGNVYALRSDFDARYQEISPGSHLNRVALEQLFGQGLKRYYMGPGANAYKYRWCDQAISMHKLEVFSHSIWGRLLASWETGVKPVAKRIRDRFSSGGTADREIKLSEW